MRDVRALAEYCRQVLDLANSELTEEYGYQYLPLCVIDAVWSIGVRYEGVRNVVHRYCRYFNLSDPWHNHSGPAPNQIEAHHTIPVMLAEMRRIGLEEFTNAVFSNRQRTSTRSGILKSEAVYQFGVILDKYGIHGLKDVPGWGENALLEQKILAIPGQTTGKSLKYFYMLCGNEALMKPDRMTIAFLENILEEKINDDEAQRLLTEVCAEMKSVHPDLTLRRLDHEIWKYQRQR